MKKFDEKKYNSLLQKLEISEVKLSELERTLRIDAEFYRKENLEATSLLCKNKFGLLTDFVSVSDGNHMSISDKFTIQGIPYYRGQNIHHFFIEQAVPIFIDEKTFEEPVMLRSHLQKGDVLLSIVGTIGKISLVYSDRKQTCSCKLAILRPTKVSSEFLASFISCKYGQLQVKRFTRGAVQMGLILEDMNQLVVPVFSENFQMRIDAIVKSAYKKIEESKLKFNQAEQTLLQTLGLSNWQPTEKNTAIKTFSASFGNSGRLDGEYYQPKYDELFNVLNKVKHLPLSSLVNFKKSIEPGSEAYQTEGIPFIRVSDISKFGISQPGHHLDRNEFDIEELKPQKDTILLTKDGSIGIAYKVEQDLDVITSGALLHLTLNSKEVLPDYLTLVLNSKLTQMQAERDAGGSIIQHWRPDEIKQVVIPILPMDTQKELANQMKNSFKLREESARLIETAKQAVEIAIEQNEKKAMEFIKANE